MQIERMWMSPDDGKKSRYALHLFGGIFGIVLLIMLVIFGGLFLIFEYDLPKEMFSFLLVCGVTVLAAILSLKTGWRSVREASVFFLTENDRMFVADMRVQEHHGYNFWNYAKSAAKTQEALRALSENPHLPAGAREVLKVKKIRENRDFLSAVCVVRDFGGRVFEQTCFIVKGYEGEHELLMQLERRMRQSLPELSASRMPVRILISALVCIGLIALCVCSHPAFSLLPRTIYFPCLAAVMIAAFFLTYFIIRYRRGE